MQYSASVSVRACSSTVKHRGLTLPLQALHIVFQIKHQWGKACCTDRLLRYPASAIANRGYVVFCILCGTGIGTLNLASIDRSRPLMSVPSSSRSTRFSLKRSTTARVRNRATLTAGSQPVPPATWAVRRVTTEDHALGILTASSTSSQNRSGYLSIQRINDATATPDMTPYQCARSRQHHHIRCHQIPFDPRIVGIEAKQRRSVEQDPGLSSRRGSPRTLGADPRSLSAESCSRRGHDARSDPDQQHCWGPPRR